MSLTTKLFWSKKGHIPRQCSGHFIVIILGELQLSLPAFLELCRMIQGVSVQNDKFKTMIMVGLSYIFFTIYDG